MCSSQAIFQSAPTHIRNQRGGSNNPTTHLHHRRRLGAQPFMLDHPVQGGGEKGPSRAERGCTITHFRWGALGPGSYMILSRFAKFINPAPSGHQKQREVQPSHKEKGENEGTSTLECSCRPSCCPLYFKHKENCRIYIWLHMGASCHQL